MNSSQIRESYLKFFQAKNHALIPPAPLVPANDPTTLFTSSGMQQLVPFLKGEPHPMGKRLVDSQPCFRSEDIDQVGDNRHTTFFEMLGNWSLADYFKKEQLTWFWQFLTQVLNLPQDKLHVTVFSGNQAVPKDVDSVAICKELGIPETRIHAYPAEKNWWSRAGAPEQMPVGEIGGPDSEVFFEFTQVKHNPKFGKTCHPNCDCGRFLEIGNSVFMEYEKLADGSLKPLPNKNVDFGGGLERLAAAIQNTPDIFQIDLLQPIIKAIEVCSGQAYADANKSAMRVIADHLRASTFMLYQGLEPANKVQGYMLRRLIRRSSVKLRLLKPEFQPQDLVSVLETIGRQYQDNYLSDQKALISAKNRLVEELNRFQSSLKRGWQLIDRTDPKKINSRFAFDLFQTYGFPFEITQEILLDKGIRLDRVEFDRQFQTHQQASRTAAKGLFKGGLADQSATTTKLHTATHLLHQALRQVLGPHVQQSGSHITHERLRFDFSHPKPLTATELKRIEALINQKITADLPVHKTIEDKEAAQRSGALAFFKQTYPDKVSVFTIGDFSKELCGGPHVVSTGEIGTVRIVKQESIGASKRRLYAILDDTQKPAR